MTNLLGKHIWVVGASSGIGAALATELVRAGCRVTISARNHESLEHVSQGRMQVLPMDICVQEDVDRAIATFATNPLDGLIVSAGFWKRMDSQELNFADFDAHVEVNLRGFARILSSALPLLEGREDAFVAGIASVAGFRGFPGSQGYGATKAAQINLLESLRSGLRQTGVRVVTICPGFVATPMTATNEFPMPFTVTSEYAARAIRKGLERNRLTITFPLRMRTLMAIARFIPAGLWSRALGRA